MMNAPIAISSDPWHALKAAEEVGAFHTAWLECLVSLIGPVEQAVLIWADAPNAGPFRPVALLPLEQLPAAELAALCERALEMRMPIQQRNAQSMLAYPLMAGADLWGVVAITISGQMPEHVLHWIHWGCGWLVEHALQTQQGNSATLERLMLTLDLLARVLEGGSARDAAQAVVTEAAQRLGCERVSLGFGDVNGIQLFALSHSADFSRRIELARALEIAMGEAADQGVTIRLDASDTEHGAKGEQLLMVREHQRIQRDFDSRLIVSVPFTDGEDCGVLMFEWAGPPEHAELPALAEAIAPVIGRALAEHRRLTRAWPLRLRSWAHEEWRKLIGPQEGKRKAFTIVAVLAVLFLIVAQGEFRVAASSKLEGGVRRMVVAPFDGFVAESMFRAGQVVEQGAVLATLDDRDLLLESSRWVNQQQQYHQQAQDAQAQHNLAQLQISLAQTRQADAQRELAQTMLDRSQIKAPFAGIIVAGDLSQQLGAAVKKGQTLYEIAPLNSYRVILEVDESDIRYVHAGQKGELIVAALSAEHFPFTVSLVTPVASAREGKNFFRVEALLEQPSAHLRPGMDGVAKVAVGSRSLVWIWTHRFFDWLRLQTWVWLGV